ncbi:hypothetical protein E2562_029834 [Oryza meyeriana var. granulata]|uniref:Uncharacterized protein n=1 Tax=Oryza meyeriana var. granulata TaxID=110450 RepID=A0A6G1ER61_9ORYZ|nr:hypothetical protein E2562_029834 [Oryza meyeriana var. granulata]
MASVERNKKLRVLLLPFFVTTHIGPFTDLAIRLASASPDVVEPTIAVTPANISVVQSALQWHDVHFSWNASIADELGVTYISFSVISLFSGLAMHLLTTTITNDSNSEEATIIGFLGPELRIPSTELPDFLIGPCNLDEVDLHKAISDINQQTIYSLCTHLFHTFASSQACFFMYPEIELPFRSLYCSF